MRFLLFCSGVCLAGLVAAAQGEEPRSHPICLPAHQIDRSQPSQDEKSIVFVMRNGDRWRNDLGGARCTGISFNGFSWVLSGNDDICENSQPLRVIGYGVCMLGKFTKLPGRN